MGPDENVPKPEPPTEEQMNYDGWAPNPVQGGWPEERTDGDPPVDEKDC